MRTLSRFRSRTRLSLLACSIVAALGAHACSLFIPFDDYAGPPLGSDAAAEGGADAMVTDAAAPDADAAECVGIDLNSAPENCGVCGRSCLGKPCDAGRCPTEGVLDLGSEIVASIAIREHDSGGPELYFTASATLAGRLRPSGGTDGGAAIERVPDVDGGAIAGKATDDALVIDGVEVNRGCPDNCAADVALLSRGGNIFRLKLGDGAAFRATFVSESDQASAIAVDKVAGYWTVTDAVDAVEKLTGSMLPVVDTNLGKTLSIAKGYPTGLVSMSAGGQIGGKSVGFPPVILYATIASGRLVGVPAAAPPRIVVATRHSLVVIKCASEITASSCNSGFASNLAIDIDDPTTMVVSDEAAYVLVTRAGSGGAPDTAQVLRIDLARQTSIVLADGLTPSNALALDSAWLYFASGSQVFRTPR